MTVKKTQLAGVLLITVLLCSGCWDKKEYNQLALAQAIAIDYADGQYQLTMQLIMPKASEETVSSENIWIIDGQGDSVGDALEQIALRAPREIYLDHLDIVLLGEALMQQDIDNGLEYLMKQNVLRRRTNLLAVEGMAGDILQAKPDLAEVDIFYLANLLKGQNRRMKGSNTIINDYYVNAGTELQEALVIPKVSAEDEKELQLSGGALLKDGVLLCWVEPEWMVSYRWIVGGLELTTLPNAGLEQQDITMEIHKSKCQWELLSREPLKIRANVKGDLYVVENKNLTKAVSPEEVESLCQHVQQQAVQQMKPQIESAIALAQEQGGDAFGLGEWLHAWHPEVIAGKDWPQLFSNAEIEVNMDTTAVLFEYR